jgi:hypothetical protein
MQRNQESWRRHIQPEGHQRDPAQIVVGVMALVSGRWWVFGWVQRLEEKVVMD